MLKYVKLFEEFNRLTGKTFVDKLRIYAEASDAVIKMYPTKNIDGNYVFSIDSNIPAENGDGKKSFLVKVPTDVVSRVSVTTYVGKNEVFSANLEPDGENDITVILKNFIEAAQLYDDNMIESLVDAYNSIHTVSDIHKILKDGDYTLKKAKK
jgi:hypothetical protein